MASRLVCTVLGWRMKHLVHCIRELVQVVLLVEAHVTDHPVVDRPLIRRLFYLTPPPRPSIGPLTRLLELGKPVATAEHKQGVSHGAQADGGDSAAHAGRLPHAGHQDLQPDSRLVSFLFFHNIFRTVNGSGQTSRVGSGRFGSGRVRLALTRSFRG